MAKRKRLTPEQIHANALRELAGRDLRVVQSLRHPALATRSYAASEIRRIRAGGNATSKTVLGKAMRANFTNLVAKSHAKGMANIGRQKSDMSGGNQVNRGIIRTGGTGLMKPQWQKDVDKVFTKSRHKMRDAANASPYPNDRISSPQALARLETWRSKHAKRIEDAHTKDMSKVGRHKADMKSRADVNRKSKALLALQTKLAKVSKATALFDTSGRVHAHIAKNYAAARGVKTHTSTSIAKTQEFLTNRAHLPGATTELKQYTKTAGTTVSAARKKAWITRRRKYGKSGGR